jgi:hypothetical protein
MGVHLMVSLAVDRLTLKLPGMSAAEAERLARRIAQGLAAGAAPAEPGRHLPALRVELAPPSGPGIETLAELALAGLLRQLK